jgi:hypothetical protein
MYTQQYFCQNSLKCIVPSMPTVENSAFEDETIDEDD